MNLATPQALAALIRRERDPILSKWEQAAQKIPGAENMERAVLRDHMPLLLDELTQELEDPEKSPELLRAFSTAHGQNRQRNGFHLPQIVEEYKMLRHCIVATAELNGIAIAGEANRVMHELIDEGIKHSIDAYIKRRDELESKRRDEYLRFLVHDLRSPLSAVYYATLLAERELEAGASADRASTITAVVKRNIEQMQALITKLLEEEQNLKTPAHLRLNRSSVGLYPIVDSAIQILTSLATVAETRIINDVSRDMIVNGDRQLLERVFQNLISNAIDNTPKGTVTIGAAIAQNDVECWVADTGEGMPKEIRDKVFDKYVTASKRRSGIGLGLPIVKQIIEAHGGTVRLDSEVGKGTVVRFSLPKNVPPIADKRVS